MKNVKKITRITLDEIQQDDYIYFGLVSPEPDYKLCLLLNSKFRISLKHKGPVDFSENQAGKIFSRFSADTRQAGITFSLVSNRSEKDYLVKKLRNIDYIFIIHDPEKELDINRLAAELRDVDSVTAVFRIDPSGIKDKSFQYLIQ
jgi:hypothetical protein